MQFVIPSSKFCSFLLVWMFFFSWGYGQERELRTTLANLSQDLKILDRQMRKLQLEMEILKERDDISSNQTSINILSKKVDQFQDKISLFEKLLAKQESDLKKAILLDVSNQMEVYFNEIKTLLQKANLNTLSPYVESVGEVREQKIFPDSYPKSGISYEVQSGDTLSQIAEEFQSRVSFIQNANRIINPAKDLRVGDIIFIPLKEE